MALGPEGPDLRLSQTVVNWPFRGKVWCEMLLKLCVRQTVPEGR